MTEAEDNQLAQLVTAVHGSSKYRSIAPGFIKRIGAMELKNRRNLKIAVKATKNKLHQVGGAYFEVHPNYPAWLDLIRTAQLTQDHEELLKVFRQIMLNHSSTHERLGILDQFYRVVLGGLPPVRSILDVACGLNPLAIPWMGLPEGVQYYAIDIYQDMMDFLREYMALLHINGYTKAVDIADFKEPQLFDVAFILKVIPCFEQIDKHTVAHLIENLNAAHLVVSYPVHSLGGKEKGMQSTYEDSFYGLVAGKPWEIKRWDFPSELVFMITK